MIESQVRYYCRQYPVIFSKAKEHIITDVNGNEYIDFFSGAGALNYGHNPDILKESLINYLNEDNITHSLDMQTVAKLSFMSDFDRIILRPRKMNYKIQFCGPTGTNAIEASLKLAKKITRRNHFIAFQASYHGMTQGAMSVSASIKNSAVTKNTFLPFNTPSNLSEQDFIKYFLDNRLINDNKPAAIVVETIQAEGGINTADDTWLLNIQSLAQQLGALLIIDDIQVGCGRTGHFFSFEHIKNFNPDIICLSKSLSGYGLPMSINLIKPDHDIWEPGEHTGTFRGYNNAFVTARAALSYWTSKKFIDKLQQNCDLLNNELDKIKKQILIKTSIKGKGMIRGIEWKNTRIAKNVSKSAFIKGLIVETCGSNNQVIKIMPALNISPEGLKKGIDILKHAMFSNGLIE